MAGVYRYRLDDLVKGSLIDEPSTNISRFLIGGWILSEMDFLGSHADFKYKIRYDYLPVAADRALLFVLTNVRGRFIPTHENGSDVGQEVIITADEKSTPRWSLTVYRLPAVWNRKILAWEEGPSTRVDTLSIAFTEPFRVLAKGHDYYFLTDSGKLYRTGERGILTGRRYMETVWVEEARPITHYLTDADADRTFLFCKPAKKDEPGVFFELGPKPEPKPYDLSKVKPSKADEPLKSVLERARFLADQNLLKNPVPPREEKKP